MVKTRQYRRKVGSSGLELLEKRYHEHIKNAGFLSSREKRILLGRALPKMLNESDFWYKIKVRAQNAMIDLILLSEISSDKLMQDILYKEHKKATILLTCPPLTLLLRSLFDTSSVNQTLLEGEKSWRAKILEEAVDTGLEWYLNSGLVKTNVHRRTLEDALDIVTMLSSGKTWEEKKEIQKQLAEAL